ncbi:hypothetical protein HY417_03400 [Candidatus Kaiserbacteria bacterium]|nr:hypothetical protein [Candidatus Kaiserbacteria bacterium]
MPESVLPTRQIPKEPERLGELGVQLLQKNFREWRDNYLQLARMLATYDSLKLASSPQFLPLRPHLQRLAKKMFQISEEMPAFLARSSDPRIPLQQLFREYLDRFSLEEQELNAIGAFENELVRSGINLPHRFKTLITSDYGLVGVFRLITWTRSKKVFSLDEETASLFRKLNYTAWQWDELFQPLPDYMIELKHKPFTYTISEGPDKGKTLAISGVLVSHSLPKIIPDEAHQDPEVASWLAHPQVSFKVFPTLPTEVIGGEPVLQQQERSNIEKIMNEKSPNFAELIVHGKKATETVLKTSMGIGYSWTFNVGLDSPVENPENKELIREILKICAGVALYMTQAPEADQGKRDIQGTGWQKNIPKKPTKKITPQSLFSDHVQIFSIRRVIDMTFKKGGAGKIVWRDLTGVQRIAHTVIGYMRRKRGEGENPLAKRTEKVKGHWKNLDSEIPAGSVGHKVI